MLFFFVFLFLNFDGFFTFGLLMYILRMQGEMEIIILTLMMGFLLAVFIAIPRVFKSGKQFGFNLNLVVEIE